MSKEQILQKTIGKLKRLDERKLKEAEDFVDFLLRKISEEELTQEIQKQAEKGEAFAFLKEEEDLYSVDDLKEHDEQ